MHSASPIVLASSLARACVLFATLAVSQMITLGCPNAIHILLNACFFHVVADATKIKKPHFRPLLASHALWGNS